MDPPLNGGSFMLRVSIWLVGQSKLGGPGNEGANESVEIVVVQLDPVEPIAAVFNRQLIKQCDREVSSLPSPAVPLYVSR
jgi:hypothetical protein